MQEIQPSSRLPEPKGNTRVMVLLALGILALTLIPINCAILGGYPGENTKAQLLVFCIGLVLGILSWVMANNILRKIQDGIIPVAAQRTVKTARIFGISATILNPALSVLVMFVALFAYSGVPTEAIIYDIEKLSAHAYEYRIRPTFIGGGGGTYTGYNIPDSLSLTESGIYTAMVLHPDTIQFCGKWSVDTTAMITVKIGPDGRSIDP